MISGDEEQHQRASLAAGQAVNRARVTRRTALAVVAVSLGVVACVLLFGPGPRLPQGILTATTEDAESDAEDVIDSGVSFSATSLNSQRNVTAVTSTMSSSGDRFFAETLAIYNLEDDLLMQRTGLTLFETLRDDGQFSKIVYLPEGERLSDGERLPDVFVTLERPAWEEGGLPVRRTFEGEVVVTASDRFRRSNHSYSHSLSPPRLQYRWRAKVDYRATQTGIESSGARYQAVSKDLATEISGQLKQLFEKLRSEHPVAGPLPAHFYPEYMPPPRFDFVSELGVEKLIDGADFMRPTVAVWWTDESHTPRQVIDAVSRSLTAAGWKVPEGDDDREYLRAANGEQVVIVFKEDDGRMHSDENAETPERMFVVYVRNMPADDIHAAIRKMFTDDADETALLMFQTFWPAHREEVEAYFRQHTPTRAESWLQLAQFRRDTQPEAARQALLRANALRRVFEQESPTSSMKTLAEELGLEELPGRISHEMMQVLGLGELREPGELEVTVRENEPAAFWLSDEDEDEAQTWLLLTPIRRPGVVPKRTLRVEVIKLREGGWSRSEQTSGEVTQSERLVHSHYLGSGKLVEVFSRLLDEGQSYRLRLRRTGPP